MIVHCMCKREVPDGMTVGSKRGSPEEYDSE